jgi:hypothetical protein
VEEKLQQKNGTIQVTNLTAAPTPTLAASNVISMLVMPYNVTVDTWRTDCKCNANRFRYCRNATKKIQCIEFCGIEATSKPINASAMTHFHTDIWSSDLTEFQSEIS